MTAAGQAFDPRPNGETRILVEETKPSLASPSGSNSNSSSSNSGSDQPKAETLITSPEQVPDASVNMLNEMNLVETIALLEEPVSELWRDARAMRKQDFPYEAREQGRNIELKYLQKKRSQPCSIPRCGQGRER